MAELRVKVRQQEGALLRVLGTVERRGYRPVAVTASAQQNMWNLSLGVVSDRPLERLIAQLRKLHDVTCVEAA